MPRTERGVRRVASDGFDLIDARRAGSISFFDLTSFLVDASALCVTQRNAQSALPPWSLTEGRIETASRRPRRLKAIPNKSQIIIIDGNGSVYIYDEDKETTRKLQLQFQCADAVDAEYIDPEFGFAISTVASDLIFYDAHYNGYEQNKSQESIQLLQWNSVHQMLVGANRIGSVTLWKIKKVSQNQRFKTPVLEKELVLHKDHAASALACHSVSGAIVAAFSDGTVVVVHPSTERIERRFRATSSIINAIAISEWGNAVVLGTNSCRPEVWSLTDSDDTKPFLLETRELPHDSPVVSVRCFPHSAHVFTLDFAGLLKAWDLSNMASQQSFFLPKDDVKVCWNFLTSCGIAQESMYVSDRKSLRQLRMLRVSKTNRGVDAEALREPAMFLTHLPGGSSPSMLFSVGGSKAAYWNSETGELAAELSATADGLIEVSAVCTNAAKTLILLGTVRGTVWIVNAASYGTIAEFKNAHQGRVEAITFVEHANFGVSVGADGFAFALSPPKAVAAAAMADAADGGSCVTSMRGQQLVRGMAGRVCQSLACASRGNFILFATSNLLLHFYDSSDLQNTNRVLLHSTIDFPPAEVLPQHVPPAGSGEALFKATGRSIVAVKQVASNTACLIISDNSSFALVEAFGAEPRIAARHCVEGMFDGSISCVELLQATSTQLTLLLGLETGLLVAIDVSDMIASMGTALPVNLRSVMLRSPILSMTLLEDFSNAFSPSTSLLLSPNRGGGGGGSRMTSPRKLDEASPNTLRGHGGGGGLSSPATAGSSSLCAAILQLDKLVIGLCDGFLDMVDATSLSLVWSSNPQVQLVPKTTSYTGNSKFSRLAKYSYEPRRLPPPPSESRSGSPWSAISSMFGSKKNLARGGKAATPSPSSAPFFAGARIETVSPTEIEHQEGNSPLAVASTQSFPSANAVEQRQGKISPQDDENETFAVGDGNQLPGGGGGGQHSPNRGEMRFSLRTRLIRFCDQSCSPRYQGVDDPSEGQQSAAREGQMKSARHSEWVETQLRSLCDGYDEADARREEMKKKKLKDAVLFRTKNLGIEVFAGNDPFSDYEPAVFPKAGGMSKKSKKLAESKQLGKVEPTWACCSPVKVISETRQDPKESFLESKFGAEALHHFSQDAIRLATPVRMHSEPIPNLSSLREVEEKEAAKTRGSSARTISLLRPLTGSHKPTLLLSSSAQHDRPKSSSSSFQGKPTTTISSSFASPLRRDDQDHLDLPILLSRPLSSQASRVPPVPMATTTPPPPPAHYTNSRRSNSASGGSIMLRSPPSHQTALDASVERHVVFGSPSSAGGGSTVKRRLMTRVGGDIHSPMVSLPPWMQ